MTVSQLDQLPGFIRLGGPDEDREIRKIYCCDLLSLVLAENAAIPEECIRKAADEGVAVYRCDEPIFETAKRIDALL